MMADDCAGCGEPKPCECIQIEPLYLAIIGLQRWLEHDLECPAFMEAKDECTCGLVDAAKATSAALKKLVEDVETALNNLAIEAAIPDLLAAFKQSKGEDTP